MNRRRKHPGKRIVRLEIPEALVKRRGNRVLIGSPPGARPTLKLRVALTSRGMPRSARFMEGKKLRRAIRKDEIPDLATFSQLKWTVAPSPIYYAPRPPMRGRDAWGAAGDICRISLVLWNVGQRGGVWEYCWYAEIIYCDGRTEDREITCLHGREGDKTGGGRPPS